MKNGAVSFPYRKSPIDHLRLDVSALSPITGAMRLVELPLCELYRSMQFHAHAFQHARYHADYTCDGCILRIALILGNDLHSPKRRIGEVKRIFFELVESK